MSIAASPAATFPNGFLWGSATAAYQVEGAASEGGRGPSVWDTYSHTPGNVRGGDTGDVACDFYHRYKDDIELMARLGLQAFRFSVAWPRIQPSGRGSANQAGLDFYRSLIEALLRRDIKPVLTLYHWDLPQALEDAGGWPERDTAQRFAEYAQIVAAALGQDCDMWATFNEPQVVTKDGYRIGTKAPGHRDDALASAATHHLLVAHGLALAALRATLPSSARIGITLDIHPVRGVGEDIEGERAISDAEQNRTFLDPLLHGRYPAAARAHMLPPDELIEPGDMELMSAPIDFLGINYYTPRYVKRSDWDDLRLGEEPLAGRPGIVDYKPPDLPRTSMGWLIDPHGLHEALRDVAAESPPGLALYITENGCAAEDYVNAEGEVNDCDRVEFLRQHFAAASRAIADGIPLAGYFVWSLLDNFEWSSGYEKRFGLIFVDYGTQRRIPKRSAAFYSEVIRANAVPLRGADQAS
ncbi:MAG: GH1 family beta-glucosidase [Solirubrobacteraceae bacterium]|jgi:beta-glucosidase